MIKLCPNLVAALRHHLLLPTDLDLAQVLGVNKSVISRARKQITLTTVSEWSTKLKAAGYNIKITAVIVDGKTKWSITDVT